MDLGLKAGILQHSWLPEVVCIWLQQLRNMVEIFEVPDIDNQ